MEEYLNYKFEDDDNFVNTFDEVPLWSASFGLFLLKHLEIKPNLKVLDIGSGTGFPLMELAERMGISCKLYGIDPWKNAVRRARQKIKNYGLSNVELIENSAEKLPFEEYSIDLIVSNLGINNFENPFIIFKECHRVLKPGGKLALTTNLTGHWKEFYQIFYATLKQLDKTYLIEILKKEEEHRGTMKSVSLFFTESGFEEVINFQESFEMKFVDGSTFLNHHFVKVGWLTSWLSLFPKNEHQEIFSSLEFNLNKYSIKNSGLTLTVPMLYVEGRKKKK
jgi:ubiquinone/menaquinone biosynthesis C-methylase UbiE